MQQGSKKRVASDFKGTIRQTMSNPFQSLSDENQDQIRKYLRFFRAKKDGLLRAIQLEINDIKAEKLNEEMFTKEDLLEYTDFLTSAIRVSRTHLYCKSLSFFFVYGSFPTLR